MNEDKRPGGWERLLLAASFVPVIAFKVILKLNGAGPDRARIASAAGLALVLLHLAAKRLSSHEVTHIEKAFLAYLGFFAACSFLPLGGVSEIVAGHSIAILYFVLCLMASVPQLLGREPFSAAIARLRQPEELWKTPEFHAINLRISFFFAGIFLLSSISAFWGREAPVFSIAIPLTLLFGAGLPFARLYPGRYLRRRGRA